MESLTARTMRQVQDRIGAEGLAAGDKLGTLSELAASFGVSRTVIREAVASLAGEGLLESRHGVGVFVSLNPASPQRRDAATLQEMAQFSGSFMDMLELRMAFEVHAAGLAAMRRSLAQEAEIWASVRDFEAAVKDDTVLDQIDFAFHQAVTQATNNTALIEFFAIMGRSILPSETFSRALHPTLITDSYIEHTLKEHRAISVQISDGNVEGAREAMRAHLTRAHDRYRGILYQGA